MVSTHRRSWVLFLAMSTALAIPADLSAAVNAWSGGPVPGPFASAAPVIAVDPTHPDTVYAVFQSDLHKSIDGGRTWQGLGSFNIGNWNGSMISLFVSPVSPSTLFASGSRDDNGWAVFQSHDWGLTWNSILRNQIFTAFTSDPSSPSTLYAGSPGNPFGGLANVYQSVDAGQTWTLRSSLGVAKQIAALVLDPRTPETIYAAGGADFDYPSSYPPSLILGKSTDSAGTWTNLATSLTRGAGAEAFVVSAANPSTLFVGLADRTRRNYPTSAVLRSSDGGATWVGAAGGLPPSTNVFGLVEAPGRPGTLYAAANTGIYRTTDSGTTWYRFGQQLDHSSIESLRLAGDRLYAGTDNGVFSLDLRGGAVDVASGAGDVRVLSWDDDRLSVRTLGPSGDWADTPPEGPFATWTATAIAGGGDGLSRVLWQSGDGRVGLEILGPNGSQAVHRFDASHQWTASDVSVGANGEAHLLWTSRRGQMFVASVDASGSETRGPGYGPYAGWTAVAIADGSDGATWVLWRHTSGRSSIARLRAGVMVSVLRWDAVPGWSVQDVTVGADGRPRVLFTNPNGPIEVFTVDAAGALAAGQTYENPGLEALRIASDADGLTRLLWNAPDGTASVWLLNPDNSLASQHAIPLRP